MASKADVIESIQKTFTNKFARKIRHSAAFCLPFTDDDQRAALVCTRTSEPGASRAHSPSPHGPLFRVAICAPAKIASHTAGGQEDAAREKKANKKRRIQWLAV